MEADALAQFDAAVLSEAAPHGTIAPAAITSEDLEIERMLERAAARPAIDNGPDMAVVHESKKRDTLRNYVEGYKPASTPQELEDQVFQAGQHDIDSVEATEKLITHYCRSSLKDVKNVGYFIFKNIRVYFDGFFEQNKNADKMTMEQKLHSGGAKIDIGPIITPQKV